jgi:hypothetical protein
VVSTDVEMERTECLVPPSLVWLGGCSTCSAIEPFSVDKVLAEPELE